MLTQNMGFNFSGLHSLNINVTSPGETFDYSTKSISNLRIFVLIFLNIHIVFFQTVFFIIIIYYVLFYKLYYTFPTFWPFGFFFSSSKNRL